MNTTLYLLNALAVVALVSFHVQSTPRDAALIDLPTDQFVPRPQAQPAVMESRQGQAAFLAADHLAFSGSQAPAPTHRTERFTF
jgi:hypothetical protein